jgi:hypothetical protein
MVGDLRVTIVGNSTSLLNQKSGQTNFQHKSGIWQNFVMSSPETLNTKLPLANSDSCCLLIQPIPMHGLIATEF